VLWVFNVTFSNIFSFYVAVGFIGWANNEVPGENYQPTTSQTLSHKVVLKDTSSGVTYNWMQPRIKRRQAGHNPWLSKMTKIQLARCFTY
jgi:hypothetical protein